MTERRWPPRWRYFTVAFLTFFSFPQDSYSFDEDSRSYDEEDFEEDEHYAHPDAAAPPAGKVLVSADDLRRSLAASREGRAAAAPLSEIDQLLSLRMALRVSDHRVQLPVFAKPGPDEPPTLVLEFDLAPPYPVEAPGMRVVTKIDEVEDDDAERLLEWLAAQAAMKLGKPFCTTLFAMAVVWTEVALEGMQRRRSEARQRKVAARLEAERAALAQKALAAEAEKKAREARRVLRAHRHERRLQGIVDAAPVVENDDGDDGESSDSGEERARRVPKFEVKSGFVPKLSHLAVKVFGDNLLLFDADGFELIPVQIRAKLFMYLLQTRRLSHRKLAMLVHADQRRLDLELCQQYLKDHYLLVLERAKVPLKEKEHRNGAHPLPPLRSSRFFPSAARTC